MTALPVNKVREEKDITKTQMGVLKLFRANGPMCDTELLQRYAKANMTNPRIFPYASDSGLRTRRSELVKYNLLQDSHQREMLPSGRYSVVWSVVVPKPKPAPKPKPVVPARAKVKSTKLSRKQRNGKKK